MTQDQNKQNISNKKSDDKTDLGITVKKSDDFSEWYQQAIIKSEFADYSAVSGCIVYRQGSYAVWEKIQRICDERLKKLGVKNVYFPLFIPERLLVKESTHLEGFSPEVAWVTHAGDTKLDEKLAVRPTSETIMYDSYSKWIRSHRDLPLKLAQWNNVVRWEFKHPVPFLRGREFLWVEGHTVFSSKEDAELEAQKIIDVWEDVMKNYLALAFMTGKKSRKETFAGAEYTLSLESVLPSGKAIQGPDFHHDGQIFAKAYDIKFLNKEGVQEYAYQNTWAITTRQIGILLGVHGDDKGLIVPPRIAPIHVVIVPILFENKEEPVLNTCSTIQELLSKEKYYEFDMSVVLDDSPQSPGRKYNHWELRGVPIRVEVGPRDVEKGEVVIVRRDNGKKKSVKYEEIYATIKELLDDIQLNMYANSLDIQEKAIVKTTDMDAFKIAIDSQKIVLAPYCDDGECEDFIKEETGAKTLNSPLDQDSFEELECVRCKKKAKLFYFGKTY